MKITTLAAASILAVAVASQASATTVIGGFNVTYNGAPTSSDPGLVVNTKNYATINFPLTSGVPYGFKLFDIYTSESSVENDDLANKPIEVNFSFTAPTAASGSANGVTYGTRSFLGIIQQSVLHWQNGATIGFTNGDTLNITLADTNFNGGFFGLGKTGGAVNASFSYTQAPTPPAVPEPATWAMLMTGFGLIGYAMRRRSVKFVPLAA